MHLRLVAIAVFLLMATCGTTAAVDDPFVYSVRCWEAGSLFADPACSCLGGSAAKLDSRPTFTVVVGSWYARKAASLARPRAVESHFYRVSLEFGALGASNVGCMPAVFRAQANCGSECVHAQVRDRGGSWLPCANGVRRFDRGDSVDSQSQWTRKRVLCAGRREG